MALSLSVYRLHSVHKIVQNHMLALPVACCEWLTQDKAILQLLAIRITPEVYEFLSILAGSMESYVTNPDGNVGRRRI